MVPLTWIRAAYLICKRCRFDDSMEKPLLTPALAPPRGLLVQQGMEAKGRDFLAGNLRVGDDVGRSGFLILGGKLTRLLVGRLLLLHWMRIIVFYSTLVLTLTQTNNVKL